jgi:hypothetical protein
LCGRDDECCNQVITLIILGDLRYTPVKHRYEPSIRAALPEIPVSRFCRCPSWQRESEYVIMGMGGTSRTLPFYESVPLWIPEQCEFNPYAVTVEHS